MEWNEATVRNLESLLSERWQSMKDEKKTDRKNLSCHWNRHLKQYDIRVLRFGEGKSNDARSSYLSASQRLISIINLINFKNEEVAERLCISNPDRPGQFLLVPRDIAAKILVLGMP